VRFNAGTIRWDKEQFEISGSSVSATLVRDQLSWPLPVATDLSSLEVYWSPDSRRALIHQDDQSWKWRVVPGAFPRVQLLYPPKAPLDEDTIMKVDALTAQVGAVVSYAGEAGRPDPPASSTRTKGSRNKPPRSLRCCPEARPSRSCRGRRLPAW